MLFCILKLRSFSNVIPDTKIPSFPNVIPHTEAASFL